MKRVFLLLLLLSSLSGFAFDQPAPSYGYFEIGYSYIEDSDDSAFDLDGLLYNVSFTMGDNFYLRGSRWELEDDFASDRHNLTRKDFALGYYYNFNRIHSVFIEGARGKYDEVFYGLTEHYIVKTKNIAVGYRVRPNEQIEVGIRVNNEKFDYDLIPDESETETTIDVVYYPTKNFGIVGQWQTFFDEDILSLKARFNFD